MTTPFPGAPRSRSIRRREKRGSSSGKATCIAGALCGGGQRVRFAAVGRVKEHLCSECAVTPHLIVAAACCRSSDFALDKAGCMYGCVHFVNSITVPPSVRCESLNWRSRCSPCGGRGASLRGSSQTVQGTAGSARLDTAVAACTKPTPGGVPLPSPLTALPGMSCGLGESWFGRSRGGLLSYL